jgi:hypothetical protein
MKKPSILILLLSLTACTALTPKNGDDICSTFREKEDWYDDTKNSFEKWGVPISVQMAIMHQESHFVADAQPPRPWLLGRDGQKSFRKNSDSPQSVWQRLFPRQIASNRPIFHIG